MNNNFLKFSGHQFETEEELKNGLDVIFAGEGSVEKTTYHDQHDGTQRIIATVRPSMVQIKEVKNGIIIDKDILKKNTSTSMSLSQEIRYICNLIDEEKKKADSMRKIGQEYQYEATKLLNRKKAELEIIRN